MHSTVAPVQLTTAVRITCPCCGSADSTIVVEGVSCHYQHIPGSYSFVKCSSCGLYYQNPRLSDAELGQCYAYIQTLDEAKLNLQTANPRATKSNAIGFLRSVWHSTQDQWPALPFVNNGPLLDIGCNFGQFLDILRDKGFVADGLEFNPHAVEFCKKKGHHVVQGDIGTIDLPTEHYATITLVHTLEHIGNPIPVLKKLRSSLTHDGQLIIVVPYVQSMMRRWFGKYWHGWDAPFHLVHFDKPTIKEVLNRSGFKLRRTVLRMSADDFTRSLNLKQAVTKRRLLTRILLTPLFRIAQWCGQGSYMIAIAEKS